jgi:ribosomal-protein-serine acetyltransferase
MQLFIDEHTYLFDLTEKDTEAFYQLIDKNRGHLRQWLGWVDGLRSVEDVRPYIQHKNKEAARKQRVWLGIWHQSELVGAIGLHHMDWTNNKASIGYWIGKAYQGRGIVRKACEQVIEYAFEELKLHRLEIYCAVDNGNSRRIPERLGFMQEGILREAHWLYDRYNDHILYARLRSDSVPPSTR